MKRGVVFDGILECKSLDERQRAGVGMLTSEHTGISVSSSRGGVGNLELGVRSWEFGMDRDPPDRETGRNVIP